MAKGKPPAGPACGNDVDEWCIWLKHAGAGWWLEADRLARGEACKRLGDAMLVQDAIGGAVLPKGVQP